MVANPRSPSPVWPGNVTRIGSYLEWSHPPAYQYNDDGSGKPWSGADVLNSDRASVIAALERMVEERRHLTAPDAVHSQT